MHRGVREKEREGEKGARARDREGDGGQTALALCPREMPLCRASHPSLTLGCCFISCTKAPFVTGGCG